MKNEVIKFLAETPKSKPDQFNQALSLYRRSKNNDQSQVRFMNSLGYSEARLEILLYELKKLHGISDLQVASARSANSKEQEPNSTEVEEIEVNDPEEVKTEADNNEAATIADDEQPEATSEASEATGDKPAETTEKTEEDTSEATSQDLEATSKDPDVVLVSVKDLDTPESSLKEKLADFDVEKESYNSIKAFAADVSDFTGEDPADQKKVTLIAFIQEAKKKLLAN